LCNKCGNEENLSPDQFGEKTKNAKRDGARQNPAKRFKPLFYEVFF
jgi:hypothetical protein